MASDFYWSSSTKENDVIFAWNVSLVSGHIEFLIKHHNLRVWPVRRGR